MIRNFKTSIVARPSKKSESLCILYIRVLVNGQTAEFSTRQSIEKSLWNSSAQRALMTVLASPLIGLIPAAICSSTPPKDYNLHYPNAALMEDPNYSRAYTSQAHQIKRHQIWRGYGIATGTVLLLVLLL